MASDTLHAAVDCGDRRRRRRRRRRRHRRHSVEFVVQQRRSRLPPPPRAVPPNSRDDLGDDPRREEEGRARNHDDRRPGRDRQARDRDPRRHVRIAGPIPELRRRPPPGLAPHGDALAVALDERIRRDDVGITQQEFHPPSHDGCAIDEGVVAGVRDACPAPGVHA